MKTGQDDIRCVCELCHGTSAKNEPKLLREWETYHDEWDSPFWVWLRVTVIFGLVAVLVVSVMA